MSQQQFTCTQINQQLMPYIKGDLSRETTAVINAHLQSCDHCARKMQEARLFEAELYQTAVFPTHKLSKDASLRIQKNVYRKMRRVHFMRRTGQMIQTSTAIAMLVFAIFGIFSLATYWLPYLSDNNEPIIPASNTIIAEKPTVTDTAVTDEEIFTIIKEQTIEQPLNVYRNSFTDNLVSVTPGQTPEEVTKSIINAALSKDNQQLFDLFVGTSVMQEPNTRMWKIFANRCKHTLSNAQDFEIVKAPLPFNHIATVRLYHDDRFSGEIKMRKYNGEWFATFSQTPHINECIQDRFDRMMETDYQ